MRSVRDVVRGGLSAVLVVILMLFAAPAMASAQTAVEAQYTGPAGPAGPAGPPGAGVAGATTGNEPGGGVAGTGTGSNGPGSGVAGTNTGHGVAGTNAPASGTAAAHTGATAHVVPASLVKPSAQKGGQLPFTGLNLMTLVVLGLLLVALGLVTRIVQRRHHADQR